MARLVHPERGTAITVPERLEARYRRRGFVSADSPAETTPTGHVCDVCGFQAKTAGGLTSHRRTHD